MSEEKLQLVSNLEMIALNQSRYVYQARRLLDYGELEVWAKPIIDTMSGEMWLFRSYDATIFGQIAPL
jgi:alpha-galactosidase